MEPSNTPSITEVNYALDMLKELARDWHATRNWTDRKERLCQKYTATWDAYRAANFNHVEVQR